MNTIRKDQRTTNLLRKGKILSISVSNGSALVERFHKAKNVGSDSVTNTRFFGPYLQDQSITVTSLSGEAKIKILDSVDIDPLSLQGGSISNIIRNPDRTIASMEIDGELYTYTWVAQKISVVNGGGITKTYTWAGNELIDVVIS